MSSTVSLDFEFAASLKQVWSALTDSGKLAQWMMENDVKPDVGRRFQFRMPPTERWNGIIDCEVLAVDEPNRLSYTWVSGGENNTVAWTLQNLGDGKTGVHLEQSGIENSPTVEGAKNGWLRMGGELEQVLAQ